MSPRSLFGCIFKPSPTSLEHNSRHANGNTIRDLTKLDGRLQPDDLLFAGAQNCIIARQPLVRNLVKNANTQPSGLARRLSSLVVSIILVREHKMQQNSAQLRPLVADGTREITPSFQCQPGALAYQPSADLPGHRHWLWQTAHVRHLAVASNWLQRLCGRRLCARTRGLLHSHSSS